MVIEYLSHVEATGVSSERVWRGVVNEAALDSPAAIAAQEAFMEEVKPFVKQLVVAAAE
jgi:hypothetical protein